MKQYSRVEKTIFVLPIIILLILGMQFYIPTFRYFEYQINGGKVALKDNVIIELGTGWFPAYITDEEKQTHITFVKINPWFPEETYLSEMDIIYKPKAMNIDSSYIGAFEKKQFRWGEGLLVTKTATKSNLVFVDGGRVHIYFNKIADLNEINSISKKH